MKMEWFEFWIFMAVFVACDHWIFAQGYDSFFQHHKTEAEKELQRLKIEELRRKVEASNAPAQGCEVASIPLKRRVSRLA